jgi:GT2 family glycosyltransferase
MRQAIDLSVVIPTHNNLPILKQCLISWDLVHDVNYELIVIEDGCSDGTAEWLATVADGERLRWFHEDDVWETLSDIRGMQEARGRYVLIWQDDMHITGDWFVAEMLANLERWQEVGAWGLMRGISFRPLTYRPQSWSELYDPVHRHSSTYGSFFFLQEVDACVRPWVVRKECIAQHGVLDEAFAPLHWDEVDYHFRLRSEGWKVAVLSYVNLGGFVHLGGTTTSKLDKDWNRELVFKNGLRFRDRWADYIERTYRRKRRRWRRAWSDPWPRGLRYYSRAATYRAVFRSIPFLDAARKRAKQYRQSILPTAK